jgi:hypothetical protein
MAASAANARFRLLCGSLRTTSFSAAKDFHLIDMKEKLLWQVHCLPRNKTGTTISSS